MKRAFQSYDGDLNFLQNTLSRWVRDFPQAKLEFTVGDTGEEMDDEYFIDWYQVEITIQGNMLEFLEWRGRELHGDNHMAFIASMKQTLAILLSFRKFQCSIATSMDDDKTADLMGLLSKTKLFSRKQLKELL